MKRTLVLLVALALLIWPEAASTQQSTDPGAGGMPPRPLPAKPLPRHRTGRPSKAVNYVTQVTRLNDEGVEETVQLSGVDAMVADGLDPLAGNYGLVDWDKLLFSAYQNQNSLGLQTLGYYSPTLEIVPDTAVSLGNHQSNDVAAGDLNGDAQAEQIAAWIGPANHLFLSIGEMPGSQRATSAPAAVARSDTAPVSYAMEFDESDDYVDVGDQVDLVDASFTVAFWAKRDLLNKNEFLVTQGPGPENHHLHIGFRAGNTFTCAFYGNDLDTPAYTSTGWHYWACTYDSGTRLRTIYRDGVQVAQDVASDNYQGSGTLLIGQSYNFDGLIDDVGIWSVARTQEQIQADPIRPAPDATGLVAYWPFDEGTGTTTADASGNGHTGTLMNEPAWSPNAPVVDLHLVVRGYDDALWHCLYDVESGDCLIWSNAAGGILASGPAIVSRGTNEFDVFALGVDNLVYQRHRDAGGWSGDWVQEPPDPALSMFASSMPQRAVPVPEWPAPAAVARGGDQIDLFRLAPDNTLRWRHSDDGNSWGAWQNLEGMLASGPGVVSLAADQMQVFARGVDEALWTRAYDGAWEGWERVELTGMDEGVTLASSPTAVSPAAGEIVVYARGSDGQLWSIANAGSAWGTWSAGVDPLALASGVGAAFWGGDTHLFTLSDHGQLHHSSDDGDTWTLLRRLEPLAIYDTGEVAAAPADPTFIENWDVDVETGSFLGDGRDQVVVAYRVSGGTFNLRVYDAQPGFEPDSLSEAVLSTGGAARITTGDFDGDGVDEIAVAMLVQDAFHWKLEVYDAYDEQGHWSENLRMVQETMQYHVPSQFLPSILIPFAGTMNIASGDFDGDRMDEIAVSSDWSFDVYPLYESRYYAYLNIFDISSGALTLKHTDGIQCAIDRWNTPPSGDQRSGFALAAGDLDGDGYDEIVTTWPDGYDAFHGHGWPNLYRRLRVIDASDLEDPQWNEGVHLGAYSWESWAERLVVADLDRDLVDEVAFFKVAGYVGQTAGTLQVHVYEYNPDDTSLEWMDAAYPDPINFDWLRSTKLVAGDYTGESLRVGTPTYRRQNRVDSLVAVINMPPKHRDYVKVDDGGGDFHYELFEVLTEDCAPTSGDPNCTHAKHARSFEESSEMGTQSQRDWAIGGGLDTKVKYAGFFADASLRYSHGDYFSESVGTINSTNFSQQASAYTHDKIVYFGTPYQVWEYPVFVEGTRDPVDYLTVMFPADDGTGSTRSSDTTTGDYPEAPWYRAGHQTYNAWSYDPVGAVGFPDYDPAQLIMDPDCEGGGCGFSFAQANSTFTETTKSKTHDFSTEVGGGYETGPEAKLIGLEASIRAYVNGSYHQADIETEKQTTSENTDISGYINDHPFSAQFNTRLIGYWAPDGYLVLDYQTDMPPNDWAVYYSSPDPAFLLPWSGFPYGEDPVPPIVGLELFSPEIQISPKSASVGETVIISATVRNFSNVEASDVLVRFCQGDPGPTCGPPDGEAYIDEVTIPQLDRDDGPVTVWVPWEASGLGEQRMYAVIDPDNTIDPEVHDEDDLISNNVAYGLAKIGAAVIVDQGLASERPYQGLSYDQGDSWIASAYVPPGNLSEVVHFELRDSSLYVPNAVGKPFELVSFEGDEFREEPNYDLALKPGSTDPPAVVGLAQSDTNVAGLTLYQAMDQAGSNWMEAACAGYPIQRFADENLIFVPVCRAGIFVFAETPPGPTPAPVADFSAAPVSGPVPLAVTFTDESSNYPTSWLWDFGDGWTSTEQHPSHLYEVPGTYTVTLSVSNPGGSDSETKPDHVNATGQLAAFSADPVLGGAPLTVSFTDQSSGNPGLTSWNWDFGDSGTSTDQHPEHTYTTTGTFTVTLTVANTQGTDTLTMPDYISVYEERLIYLPVVLRGAP